MNVLREPALNAGTHLIVAARFSASPATFPADRGHMFSIFTYGFAAFAADLCHVFTIAAYCGAALAGYLFLQVGIHRGKTAISSVAPWFRFRWLCTVAGLSRSFFTILLKRGNSAIIFLFRHLCFLHLAGYPGFSPVCVQNALMNEFYFYRYPTIHTRLWCKRLKKARLCKSELHQKRHE
jgi:hypothetical protein